MAARFETSVCVVTGATGSIGKATATRLAGLGATVILICRDQERGLAVKREISEIAGNSSLELQLCDLSRQSSIRGAVTQLLSGHERIQILVNTAAVFVKRRVVTEEGLELMFATNHLGPFLLTNLLLDSLITSAPSRIITVSAPSTTELNFEDLQSQRQFNALNAFGASKTANLLVTYELSRRLGGKGVTANVIHPGLVRSSLMREAPFIVRWISTIISRSPGRAANSIVHLASSPEVEGITGQFFRGTKASSSSLYSQDRSVQEHLWQISAELVGLKNQTVD